jgi:hypothetical protein
MVWIECIDWTDADHLDDLHTVQRSLLHFCPPSYPDLAGVGVPTGARVGSAKVKTLSVACPHITLFDSANFKGRLQPLVDISKASLGQMILTGHKKRLTTTATGSTATTWTLLFGEQPAVATHLQVEQRGPAAGLGGGGSCGGLGRHQGGQREWREGGGECAARSS